MLFEPQLRLRSPLTFPGVPVSVAVLAAAPRAREGTLGEAWLTPTPPSRCHPVLNSVMLPWSRVWESASSLYCATLSLHLGFSFMPWELGSTG